MTPTDKEHCTQHDRNTEDITSMKANMRLLMWLTPIAIAGAGAITGYTLKGVNDSVLTVSANVQTISSAVQQSAIVAAVNSTKLTNLENNIEDIQRRQKR